jgi:hypothetical protein
VRSDYLVIQCQKVEPQRVARGKFVEKIVVEPPVPGKAEKTLLSAGTTLRNVELHEIGKPLLDQISVGKTLVGYLSLAAKPVEVLSVAPAFEKICHCGEFFALEQGMMCIPLTVDKGPVQCKPRICFRKQRRSWLVRIREEVERSLQSRYVLEIDYLPIIISTEPPGKGG